MQKRRQRQQRSEQLVKHERRRRKHKNCFVNVRLKKLHRISVKHCSLFPCYFAFVRFSTHHCNVRWWPWWRSAVHSELTALSSQQSPAHCESTINTR